MHWPPRSTPATCAGFWLSHTDADHIGNLVAVLERAPRAQVVTNFLGMGVNARDEDRLRLPHRATGRSQERGGK